ncbi:hypothetical protein FKM82_022692 [Ascaphus truei]
MEILGGSAVLVTGTVLLCGTARAVCRSRLPDGLSQQLALEVVSTVQLCCCVRELALLGGQGELHPAASLFLTYLVSLVHGLSCGGAACNPCGSLEQYLRGEAPAGGTALGVSAQLGGALLCRLLMPALWSLQLSPLHRQGTGSDCHSALRTSLLSGAAVEMACTLCLFCLLRNLERVQPAYRPHLVSLLITGLVYTGGHLTGAVFNPALAFSIMFHCKGNTLFEYAFVYWIGPIIGMVLSVILFDKCIPRLRSSDSKTVVRAGQHLKKHN